MVRPCCACGIGQKEEGCLCKFYLQAYCLVAHFAANGKRPGANDPETGVNRAVHKKFTFPLDKQRTDFYNSTVG